MDPLALLRQYTIADRIDDVKIAGDRIQFGDQYDFPKNVTTAYRSQQGHGSFYDLETLLVFLKNKAVPHSQYLRSTKQSGIAAVTFQDRKLLLDYLTGQVETSTNVQFTDEVFRAGLVAKRSQGQAGVSGSEPQAKHARTDAVVGLGVPGDLAATSTSRERALRNRNSMLVLPGKDFTSLITIADKALQVFERDLKRMEAAPQPKHKAPSSHAKVPNIEIKSSGRFNREPAPAPKEIKELGIDVYGTKAPEPAAPKPEAPPPPPPAAKPAKPKIWKHATNGTYVDHKGRPCDASGRLLPPSSSRHHKPSSSKASAATQMDRIPMIIVPEGLSAIVNMYNAKQLLQDGQFVTVKDAQGKNPIKPETFVIERPGPDPKAPTIKYFVTDQVPSETSSKWRRVVCVVCQGKNWQFKDFPFKGAKEGNLVDTFQNVCGIFFHYKDEDVPEVVRSWNVKILPLPRSHRNHDITIAQEMFTQIRKFLDNKAKSNIRTGCVPKQLRYGSLIGH